MMFKIIKFLLIAIIGIMLSSCGYDGEHVHINRANLPIEHFEYKNHEYFYIFRIGVVHNPDCKCNKSLK